MNTQTIHPEHRKHTDIHREFWDVPMEGRFKFRGEEFRRDSIDSATGAGGESFHFNHSTKVEFIHWL